MEVQFLGFFSHGQTSKRLYPVEEYVAFVNHINSSLQVICSCRFLMPQGDKDLEGRIPILPEEGALFRAIGDGIILWYILSDFR